MVYPKKIVQAATLLLLVSSLLLGGCTNMTPLEPQNPTVPPSPAKETTNVQEHTVTYNYGDTGPIQLSANNLVLNIGQKLVLQPAPGLTKNTRFTSGTDNFWGDVMQQEGEQTSSGQLIFTAKNAGKGKLQIIPNSTETDRATDLWVTVK
jgi:hypothetical protein